MSELRRTERELERSWPPWRREGLWKVWTDDEDEEDEDEDEEGRWMREMVSRVGMWWCTRLWLWL
jgi:hypothetical protein